jgi:hypothetical protein
MAFTRGARGEEPSGETCQLPRFHKMRRLSLLALHCSTGPDALVPAALLPEAPAEYV